jgi:hypothetical protein
MMMVMMMGMMGSCVMSAVGGLGLWYMKDPTLGGLLEDLNPPDVPEPGADGGDGDDGTPNSSTSIPLDQKVYIHGTLNGCGENGSTYSLLYATNDTDVNVDCQRVDANKNNYLWTISAKKSGKWTYYTIKNAGKNKYLSVSDSERRLSLSSDATMWRLKAQTDDAQAFTVSTKDNVSGYDKKQGLNYWGGKCESNTTGRRINTVDIGEGDLRAQGDNSRFKFLPVKDGWKKAGINDCKSG